jgi:FK506-binding protein 4/5
VFYVPLFCTPGSTC